MGQVDESYQAPDWLTAEFLQDVLQEHYKDDALSVCDLSVESAASSSTGVGFASELHRASCMLRRGAHNAERFSVIIKAHPKGYTGIIAHKSKLFKREILAYKEILPRIQALLQSIGDNTKLAPECFYATETPEPFIVLEDMNNSGYENFERQRLLNLDYVLPTIERLAKLHACSAYIAAENPASLEFFHEAPISRNPERKDFLGFFPVNVRCIAEEIATWKGYEQISVKMFNLAENVLQQSLAMYEAHAAADFRVLNVADLWIDNLMFRLNPDTKEPEHAVILDYQLAYFGSPAIDLNYFLYGSFNENIRKMHFKYVIYEYQRVLSETLKKLNYKAHIPSLKELHMDLIKNSLQGVIATTCLTPIIFMDPSGFQNFENFNSRTEDGDKLRKENASNPRYRAYLQRTVKEFELSGFLD